MKGIAKHCYTQNIKALGLMVSEKIFSRFSYCKSMGAKGASARLIWTPGA